RFEEPADMVVELGDGVYRALGDVERARLEDGRAKLMNVLDQLEQPGSTEEIAAALGVASGTARSRLDSAMRRLEVARTGAGVRGDRYRWSTVNAVPATASGLESQP